MVNPVTSNVGMVVLAAGRGKRMNATSDLPKVLVPLAGQPLLAHLIASIKESAVPTKPVVVIAPDLYVIRERIGPACEYAIQESQLGTGHAVLSAKPKLKKYDHILVLYGDHPLVTASTIDALSTAHLKSGADLTLATLRLPNFEDWYSFFDGYGRIRRDELGRLQGIVERKDASVEELAITEVNPGYYVFRAAWLWNALTRLKRENASGEYYLTDLIEMALVEGRVVKEVTLERPEEGIGINTPEQLKMAEDIVAARLDASARMHTAQLPF